jgi:membrane protein required for colicin V production
VALGGIRAIYASHHDGNYRVNWVDLAILAVILFSGLLAFMRGFVREVLSIGAWIGAGLFAMWAFPFVQERFRGWIANADLADPIAFGAMFLASLIFLSVIAGMIGAVVRGSVLGGIDRTLGMAFGLVRGAALVVFAYIAGGLVVSADHWPEPVLSARSLPYAHDAAVVVVSYLPVEYRPKISDLPQGRETRAENLLHATPQGRAVAARP